MRKGQSARPLGGMARSVRHAALAALVALAAGTGLVVGAAEAAAQVTTAPPPGAGSVVAEASAAISAGSSIPWGWNQIVVRVQNNGAQPARGEVEVTGHQYTSDEVFQASAPYTVGPSATVHVRVPVRVPSYGSFDVRVMDERLGEVRSQSFNSNGTPSVVLLDVVPASRLRAAIHEMPVAPLFLDPTSGTRGPSSSTSLMVSQANVDPATGDPLLPDRPALYASADAVLMRTDTLSRLHGAELDALAGFVLGGGTVALIVARPEDLRSQTLVSLVGGEVTGTTKSPELKQAISPTPSASGMGGRALTFAPHPKDEVGVELRGWAGGNLRPSPYGNAATYGLGEVHLLAFDPSSGPALDDPWVHVRLVDLARRAYDRRSTVVFKPGSEPARSDVNKIRRELDPNESTRWSVLLSTLILCIYAVLAGPVNFTLARQKHKPLRALWHLPLYAAAAFGTIVGIGIAARGLDGRARHLTLVEAGAGMTQGAARRYRGFFASQSEGMTVRTTDASSVVSTAVAAELSKQRDKLVVDRDGARLVNVAALPWQTVVIREDGFASLGEGISVVPTPSGGATVVNRSGRTLRAAVLVLPGGKAFLFERIADGDRVASTAGRDLSTFLDGQTWLAAVTRGRTVGSLSVHNLEAPDLGKLIGPVAPGLSDAWQAMGTAASHAADWFPDGVPTLIAQLDGGEGRRSDTGLRLESDRLLVRIVGWGGRP
ncbi:hypothetical protein [Chondromyces apiculatus]|uniref:Uncharacterized protein n=1 Tax=Chondromyces apiculatus DSM 436 TaxID=1192034 RepID=A0A017T0N2_9BACT|nr:hypothetical protein [Chondromyces apiculatus]EYF02086.1 Hypothetical protein CAP_7426 [Chondromyces apiculatus DSM 436]